MPTQSKSTQTKLKRLQSLAMNLWWSFNADAQTLFAATDPRLWLATHRNPIRTLQLLPPERRNVIETDPAFEAHLLRVEKKLADYLASPSWFGRTYPKFKNHRGPLIAYFCAEFAVHECLPQYSGGLGVLAGDHIKSASDLGLPLVGIGLLYKNGFYTQQFADDGSTHVIYPDIDFTQVPIADTGKTIDVDLAGKKVRAKIWRQVVGRIEMLLLDTNVEPNKPADRELTKHLYGGDREYRIRQEMLLGVGGLQALDAMNYSPTVFHMNEGHAAFAALERVRRLVQDGAAFDQAVLDVRQTNVFTTHTPVPAGNDRFVPKLVLKYIAKMGAELGLEKDALLALGREDPKDRNEEFCMTVLALKLSERCNGVAALHGEVSRGMWMKVFGAADAKDVPIRHVTNGIHSQTWLAPEMTPFYEKYLKSDWNAITPDFDPWKRANKIPPAELWNMRSILRTKLVDFVRERLVEQAVRHHGTIEEIQTARRALRADALTIGFARRFATYKRGTLIFNDGKRLAKLVGSEDRPVQFVFAGKAHPQDKGGQDFAQQIHQHAREAKFRGKIVILEDYDLELGRMLTSGVDVWLNNPLRPLEASGTSGMKPPLHGGVNLSILDGWWPEAFNGKNGWAIGTGEQLDDEKKQNTRDANHIYDLLETELIPQFYDDRNGKGVPSQWTARMINSMQSICAQFSTARMVGEYATDYYMPAAEAGR